MAIIRRIMLMLAVAIMAATGAQAQDFKVPHAPLYRVTDEANVLSPAVRIDLERKLGAFEKKTTHQFIVWVGNSTQGVPLESWTIQAAKAWEVGQKDKNDGLILFLFIQDRKMRFETGYGLEGAFPDVTAKRILADVMRPALKAGDPGKAVVAGVDAAIQALTKEAAPVASPKPHAKPMPAKDDDFSESMTILAMCAGFAAICFGGSLWWDRRQDRKTQRHMSLPTPSRSTEPERSFHKVYPDTGNPYSKTVFPSVPRVVPVVAPVVIADRGHSESTQSRSSEDDSRRSRSSSSSSSSWDSGSSYDSSSSSSSSSDYSSSSSSDYSSGGGDFGGGGSSDGW